MNIDTTDDPSIVVREIQNYISLKQYDQAIDATHQYLLDSIVLNDKDGIAFGLEVIGAICDKSSETLSKSMEVLGTLLDHTEYWVKQEALNILKKIFPQIPSSHCEMLVEKCESKLFDSDKRVREAAVQLVASILKHSFTKYPDIYLTYARLFHDESWRVRARALEGVLLFLNPEVNPPADMITAFHENIMHLLRDPDEEIRGLTAEVIRTLSFHLNPSKVQNILISILGDSDWEIREKGIWIIGEIGANFFNDLIPLFKILVGLFSDIVMMIQTKTIDAFVKIGKTHGKELLEFFKPFIIECVNKKELKDQEDGISESMIFITLQNLKLMLPVIITQLSDSESTIRTLFGNCLLKIYMERPDGFEEELVRLFQSLNPEDWRQRKTIIKTLGDLCYVLHIQSVAVWTVINLQNWLKNERDLDVIEEIETSQAKIHTIFDKIDDEIHEMENQRQAFYTGLERFQTMTKEMRIKAEQFIDQKKFLDAEIFLEEEGTHISEKVEEYEKILQESSFKRFSIEVLQDFKEIKEEILEEITDVKSVMLSHISIGRTAYLEVLNQEIQKIRDRIDNTKLELVSLQKIENEIDSLFEEENSEITNTFLATIRSIRDNVYMLEFDIGQFWLQNLEFKEDLKEITIYWVDTKIEIQQYLANLFQKFNLADISEPMPQKAFLKQKLTLDFLTSNLQNIIIQAIQSIREILERFPQIIEPIYKEIRKRKLKDAHNLVDLSINNLTTTIENYDAEIRRVYEDIDRLNLPQVSTEHLQVYLTNWKQVKDSLLDQMYDFKIEVEDEILIEEIKEFLKYMNPIPLDQLTKSLSIPLANLRDRILTLIQNHQLQAEIRKDEIIQPERPIGENFLMFHRKVEILGAKITFNLRIFNPTKYFLNDINLTFLYPDFLKILKDESDTTEIVIRDFEPDASRMIKFQFRIDKPSEKKYELKKWLLHVNYLNPFGKISKLEKEMEIIL